VAGFHAVGEVHLLPYPALRLARTPSPRGADTAFWVLINHVKKHDVPMSAPVEATLDTLADDPERPRSLAFLYPSNRLGRLGRDGAVEVEDVPAGTAVSIGLLGEPSGRWFGLARAALAEWLQQNAGDYEPAGPPRLLNYNSPRWSCLDVATPSFRSPCGQRPRAPSHRRWESNVPTKRVRSAAQPPPRTGGPPRVADGRSPLEDLCAELAWGTDPASDTVRLLVRRCARLCGLARREGRGRSLQNPF
jgi:hypothetical protein